MVLNFRPIHHRIPILPPKINDNIGINSSKSTELVRILNFESEIFCQQVGGIYDQIQSGLEPWREILN